ncbi:MAG: hypothetical protein V3S01_01085 [Dehalococcoidia bacterium]
MEDLGPLVFSLQPQASSTKTARAEAVSRPHRAQGERDPGRGGRRHDETDDCPSILFTECCLSLSDEGENIS